VKSLCVYVFNAREFSGLYDPWLSKRFFFSFMCSKSYWCFFSWVLYVLGFLELKLLHNASQISW